MTGFLAVEIWTPKFRSCIFLLVPTIETLTILESHIGEKSLALQKHIKARVPKMAFSSYIYEEKVSFSLPNGESGGGYFMLRKETF